MRVEYPHLLPDSRSPLISCFCVSLAEDGPRTAASIQVIDLVMQSLALRLADDAYLAARRGPSDWILQAMRAEINRPFVVGSNPLRTPLTLDLLGPSSAGDTADTGLSAMQIHPVNCRVITETSD